MQINEKSCPGFARPGGGADKQVIACQLLVPLVMDGGEGCSGLMAWGEYTKDGATVAGRNWDLPGNKPLFE